MFRAGASAISDKKEWFILLLAEGSDENEEVSQSMVKVEKVGSEHWKRVEPGLAWKSQTRHFKLFLHYLLVQKYRTLDADKESTDPNVPLQTSQPSLFVCVAADI